MTTVELIRSSFTLVLEAAPDLTERFYARLFADAPELQPLFGRNSRKAQADMLAKALIAVVDHLEDAQWLSDTLGALGDKHRGYGVSDAMYPVVAKALLATLEDAAGPHWTPPVARAWGEALNLVAGAMIRGSAARPAA